MKKIELTEQQINILYQIILQTNWNGAQLEIALELKKKFEQSIKEMSGSIKKELDKRNK